MSDRQRAVPPLVGGRQHFGIPHKREVYSLHSTMARSNDLVVSLPPSPFARARAHEKDIL